MPTNESKATDDASAPAIQSANIPDELMRLWAKDLPRYSPVKLVKVEKRQAMSKAGRTYNIYACSFATKTMSLSGNAHHIEVDLMRSDWENLRDALWLHGKEGYLNVTEDQEHGGLKFSK